MERSRAHSVYQTRPGAASGDITGDGCQSQLYLKLTHPDAPAQPIRPKRAASTSCATAALCASPPPAAPTELDASESLDDTSCPDSGKAGCDDRGPYTQDARLSDRELDREERSRDRSRRRRQLAQEAWLEDDSSPDNFTTATLLLADQPRPESALTVARRSLPPMQGVAAPHASPACPQLAKHFRSPQAAHAAPAIALQPPADVAAIASAHPPARAPHTAAPRPKAPTEWGGARIVAMPCATVHASRSLARGMRSWGAACSRNTAARRAPFLQAWSRNSPPFR